MYAYKWLVRDVLKNGTPKTSRNGVKTFSVFGYSYKHEAHHGFPLLTTKKISWKNIVVELLWFLSGSNESSFLERHKCKFWRPWYNEDGTVNSPYGPAWRSFEHPIEKVSGDAPGYWDQVDWAIRRLKSNPESRDIVISAYQPHIAQNPPSQEAYWSPCHTLFILNVQEKNKLNLHLTQRSADIAVGVPYNIASYFLLLELFARFTTGLEADTFMHSIADAHVYENHIAALQEQTERSCRPLPKLRLSDSITDLESVMKLLHHKVGTKELMSHFVLEGYNPHPKVKFDVAV